MKLNDLKVSTISGRAGGRQGVSINDACMYMGTVAHEIAHAVGFWHEQSRPDRDESVEVLWENIEPGKEHNFNKMDYTQIDSRGVQYDYNSIMHYGAFSFSISNTKPTMVAKRKSEFHNRITMGQRDRLSTLDILQANTMYCCPQGACADNPCQRGLCEERITPPFYHCSCFEDWYGVNCSVNDNKCALLPCGNGVCRADESLFAGFECICNEGYTGLLCDKEIDECEEVPCKNGGKCLDKIGGYTCECDEGYRGDNCEFLRCPQGMFGCLESSVCVSKESVCDFNNDCGDWSDERDQCGECSFERGMCGWVSESDWKWNISSGGTLSQETGPEFDNTFRNTSGKYVYVEASAAVETGTRAELDSLIYQASATTCSLEFAYHMFGTEVGTLVVELGRHQPEPLAVTELFRISGNQGNQWHRAKVTISKQFFFHIRFVAIKGSGRKGDIAIDDIAFSDCSMFQDVADCNDNQCMHGQCLDGVGSYSCQCFPGFSGELCEVEIDECETDPCGNHGVCEDQVNGFLCSCMYGYIGDRCEMKADYLCDMQEGLCPPWRHSQDSDFMWKKWAGQTPSKGTGPDTDHTTRSAYGYYLFIEGSEPQEEGDRAVLEMGPLSRSEEDCLLSFAYHMHGDTMGTLSVSVLLHNGSSIELWSCRGNQGNQWKTVIVELGVNEKFVIQIAGEIGHFWESDAALDDIMLTGRCGIIDPCLVVDCGEHSHCMVDQNLQTFCECDSGFQGPDCSERKDHCIGKPCHNGKCLSLEDGYSCECYDGFQGKHCERGIRDNCSERLCKNGLCINLHAGHRCVCDPGYAGQNCDVPTCSPNPCFNGGICIQLAQGYLCQCERGFGGSLCEDEINMTSMMDTDNVTLINAKDTGELEQVEMMDSCKGCINCLQNTTSSSEKACFCHQDLNMVRCENKHCSDLIDCFNMSCHQCKNNSMSSKGQTFITSFILHNFLISWQFI